MFLFEEEIYFYLLGVIPVFVLLYLMNFWWKKRTQTKFAEESLFKKLVPTRSSFKPLLKFITLMLAVASLVVALANLKMGTKMETVKREGVDVVFAIVVPEEAHAEHLKSLAKIAEILSNEKTLCRIRNAHCNEALYDILESAAKS